MNAPVETESETETEMETEDETEAETEAKTEAEIESETNKTSSSPNTGDTANIGFGLAMGFLSMILFAASFFAKKYYVTHK